jgi:hypothetical protein
MEDVKLLQLEGNKLTSLPLFFRKIYYNPLTTEAQEHLLITFQADLQADTMSAMTPRRPISKTVDFTRFEADSKSELTT